MTFQNYQPTHRETEVLAVVKDAAPDETSRSHIREHTTAAQSVVDSALENLETLGYIKQVTKGRYVFVHDPLDAVFED